VTTCKWFSFTNEVHLIIFSFVYISYYNGKWAVDISLRNIFLTINNLFQPLLRQRQQLQPHWPLVSNSLSLVKCIWLLFLLST
jgi:hypothetical protein